MHRHIHERVPGIPIPNKIICEGTIEQLKMLEKYNAIKESDSITQRLNVLICCLDNGESPTAEALKKQLEAIKTYKPG